MNAVTAIGEPLSERELCPEDLLAAQEAAFARDIDRMLARKAEFVALPCPACDGKDQEPAFAKFGFDFVRCARCGTIHMWPRPSEAVMADYYSNSENYRFWATHIFPASEAVRRKKIHEPWLERILSKCHEYEVEPRRLIDVGPGFGTFCSVAVASGRFDSVVGIEPTPEMAEACRARGVEVIEKRIEDIDGSVEPADVVVAFEVVEHLYRPRDFVRCARRLVRPGGLLVLTCPNGEGFDIATLGPVSQAVDAEHVNLFNPRSLAHLVTSEGFDVLDVTTPGRLDAEIVRDATLTRQHSLDDEPFLRRVLIDEWERLGWPFQQFLAANNLSSHMWLVARLPERGRP